MKDRSALWVVVRRPLALLFVCGCVVSVWASGRLSVRLIADRAGPGPRMVGLKTGADWTARMRRFAAARVAARARAGVAGVVRPSA